MLGATPDPRFKYGKVVKLSAATQAVLMKVAPAAVALALVINPISGYLHGH